MSLLGILGVIVLFVVVGFVLQWINKNIDMEAGVKKLMNVTVWIVLFFFALHITGIWGMLVSTPYIHR